jgi:hypothetical protein
LSYGRPLDMKRCPDCGEVKPDTEFGGNAARPDGLAFYCRACSRVRANAHYRKKQASLGRTVRDRVTVDGAKRCATCDEVKPVSEFHRSPRQSGGYNCYCKPCRSTMERQQRFLREYGLTEADLAALVASQGGLCAICGERPAVHVDHDHVTGAVRGVLCFPCNAALGQFKDRIDLLARAASYLETTTWQKTRVCTGVYRLRSPRQAAPPSPTSSALSHLISSRRAGAISPPV